MDCCKLASFSASLYQPRSEPLAATIQGLRLSQLEIEQLVLTTPLGSPGIRLEVRTKSSLTSSVVNVLTGDALCGNRPYCDHLSIHMFRRRDLGGCIRESILSTMSRSTLPSRTTLVRIRRRQRCLAPRLIPRHSCLSHSHAEQLFTHGLSSGTDSESMARRSESALSSKRVTSHGTGVRVAAFIGMPLRVPACLPWARSMVQRRPVTFWCGQRYWTD